MNHTKLLVSVPPCPELSHRRKEGCSNCISGDLDANQLGGGKTNKGWAVLRGGWKGREGPSPAPQQRTALPPSQGAYLDPSSGGNTVSGRFFLSADFCWRNAWGGWSMSGAGGSASRPGKSKVTVETSPRHLKQVNSEKHQGRRYVLLPKKKGAEWNHTVRAPPAGSAGPPTEGSRSPGLHPGTQKNYGVCSPPRGVWSWGENSPRSCAFPRPSQWWGPRSVSTALEVTSPRIPSLKGFPPSAGGPQGEPQTGQKHSVWEQVPASSRSSSHSSHRSTCLRWTAPWAGRNSGERPPVPGEQRKGRVISFWVQPLTLPMSLLSFSPCFPQVP